VKLNATRPRAVGTSAQITRVEWSAAELNATVGEVSVGSSAAMGIKVDTPPAGAPDPSTASRNRVEAPRTGAGASPGRIRREPVAQISTP